MKMYNFDIVPKDSGDPVETVHAMMRSLDEARNRCANLYQSRDAAMGVKCVRLREDGGSKVIYSFPEGA